MMKGRAYTLLFLIAAFGGETSAQASVSGAGQCDVPGAFAYDARASLQLRDTQVAVLDGVQMHRISFASPLGGRVSGFLFRPDATPPRGGWPGVVAQHGLPSDARSMRPVGGNIASHGAVVIAIDAPFARRGGAPLWLTERDSVEQVQLMVDLRRAFDILAARNDVDSARLAYVGVSYGGAMGALLAGIEHRPKTYVLIVGDGGLVAHFVDINGPSAVKSLPQEQRDRWLRAMRPIEPLRFVHCARARLLFHSATHDRLVQAQQARRLHDAAPQPKVIRWYDADHNIGIASFMDELQWLHETIGTAVPRRREELWCRRTSCPGLTN